MYFYFILKLVVLLSAQNVDIVRTSNHHHRTDPRNAVNATSDHNNSTKFIGGSNHPQKLFPDSNSSSTIILPVLPQQSGNRAPAYLNLMYEKLSKHQKTFPSNHEAPILRALFPSEITSGGFGAALLKYNVSIDRLENFSSAHLVLTRSDEVNFQSPLHLNVNIQFQDQELILSQRVQENMRFYLFNISELLREALKIADDGNGNTSFDMKCDIFKNIRRKKIWFQQMFDTEMEKPFIMIEFQGLDMAMAQADLQYQEKPNKKLSRRRRSLGTIIRNTTNSINKTRAQNKVLPQSISTTPEFIDDIDNDLQIYPSLEPPLKTICKKHEWLAKPSDVGLDDVIQPTRLDLGFCSGSCPYPLLNDVFNFTLHSYFVDQHRLLKGFNIPNNFPISNCVPVSYKNLMVMQMEDDGGFVFIIHKDASVDSCGCR